MLYFSSVLISLCLLFASVVVDAAPQLSKTSIVIDSSGLGEISVKNEGKVSYLLVTTIAENPSKSNGVSFLPSLARILPGESVIIEAMRSDLSAPMVDELLIGKIRALPLIEEFEPDGRMGQIEGVAAVGLDYRLPVLIEGLSSSVSVDDAHDLLMWTVSNNKLVVRNPSSKVLRFGPSVDLVAAVDEHLVSRHQSRVGYVLPGEEVVLEGDVQIADGDYFVRFTPVRMSGFTRPMKLSAISFMSSVE